MATQITITKAAEVARTVSNKYKVEYESKLQKVLDDKLAHIALDIIPQDVLAICEKYPTYLDTTRSFIVYTRGFEVGSGNSVSADLMGYFTLPNSVLLPPYVY